jgi:hypothetical protein
MPTDQQLRLALSEYASTVAVDTEADLVEVLGAGRQRNQRRVQVLIAAAVAVLAILGYAGVHNLARSTPPVITPSHSLVGIWTKNVTAQQSELVTSGPAAAGPWTLTLDQTGQLSITPPLDYTFANGVPATTTATATAEQIRLTALGSELCNGSDATYQYTVQSPTLQMTPVTEPCDPRRSLLEGIWLQSPDIPEAARPTVTVLSDQAQQQALSACDTVWPHLHGPVLLAADTLSGPVLVVTTADGTTIGCDDGGAGIIAGSKVAVGAADVVHPVQGVDAGGGWIGNNQWTQWLRLAPNIATAFVSVNDGPWSAVPIGHGYGYAAATSGIPYKTTLQPSPSGHGFIRRDPTPTVRIISFDQNGAIVWSGTAAGGQFGWCAGQPCS